MKFSCNREALLKPLQVVQGVVERRQSLPILANVLLRCEADGQLVATATDMELELSVRVPMPDCEAGDVTVPARKLLDICRSLPAEAPIVFSVDKDRVVLRSGRSRFTLSTLPVRDYPSSDVLGGDSSLSMTQGALKRLLDLSHFAMAHQDVRYYLNGMLIEMGKGRLRTVATDGHRLAVAEASLDGCDSDRSMILPRKGVMELLRLLGSGEEPVTLSMGNNAVQLDLGEIRLTSKLIDGRFPDYERVIPREEVCDKRVSIDRETLRQSLQRVAILSNDKYRAVRVILGDGLLRLLATNPEQEQAEEEIEVAYDGEALEIGFNVSYLIDALVNLPAENAVLLMTDSSSSCLIRGDGVADCEYVVMPMRL